MIRNAAVTPQDIAALADIHVSGIWVWVHGATVFLADPLHSAVHCTSTLALLTAGLLEESEDHLSVQITPRGLELIRQHPGAVERAQVALDGRRRVAESLRCGKPTSTRGA